MEREEVAIAEEKSPRGAAELVQIVEFIGEYGGSVRGTCWRARGRRGADSRSNDKGRGREETGSGDSPEKEEARRP